MALVDGLNIAASPRRSRTIDESEWTLQLLKEGRAELAPSEVEWRARSEAVRGHARGVPAEREHAGWLEEEEQSRPPSGVEPPKKQRQRVNSFDRREALTDMAERLTRKRKP